MPCAVLMSCESNPDVISIPIQVGKSRKYKDRKFGFWYHLTLSSSTMRVKTGSAASAAPERTMLKNSVVYCLTGLKTVDRRAIVFFHAVGMTAFVPKYLTYCPSISDSPGDPILGYGWYCHGPCQHNFDSGARGLKATVVKIGHCL